MPPSATLAEALLAPVAPAALLRELGSKLIKPLASNFVERPWGGTMLREFKGLSPLPAQTGRPGGTPADPPRPVAARLNPLPEQAGRPGARVGEAFEIAACDADPEAREYPSRVELADGSVISLADLLAAHGATLLGAGFVARHGAGFPLLPKILDIKELLSVQAHPPGHTEVYVIIAAEPGATIRVGFNADIDAVAMKARLKRGLENQRRLLELLRPDVAPEALQAVVADWLARRPARADELQAAFVPFLASAERWPAAAQLLGNLKTLYGETLGMLNAIPVTPGQVIHNATPQRLLRGSQRIASAEVHALGNPQRREILALEIRRPGPTLRAWDNVRFPVRAVDVDAAFDAMNLSRTEPAEFLVTPTPVAGRPGAFLSVDSEFYRVEHLRPTPALSVEVPAAPPHCLHALGGRVVVRRADGVQIGRLARGESALVPAGVGAYAISTDAEAAEAAEVVKASPAGPS